MPQGAAFSHMAKPSRTPTVRDADASSAKDAARGAAEAASGEGQQSCYSFSEGDVVEVSWGRKRTKYDATVLAIDDSKKKKPVHVQFGDNSNSWVSAASVVKRTDGAVAPPGTLVGLGARLAAAGGLTARADLIYKTSQHSKSNEAVAPTNGAAVAPASGNENVGRWCRWCKAGGGGGTKPAGVKPGYKVVSSQCLRHVVACAARLGAETGS